MVPAQVSSISTLFLSGHRHSIDMLHSGKPLPPGQVAAPPRLSVGPTSSFVSPQLKWIAAIDPLFLTQCSCSNKCSVLVNHPSQGTLNALERSNWGAHLIEGKSTALGLLLYGKFSRSHQGWTPVEELEGTQAINPKAMSKANHRLALFASPAHSVVQRSLANNCFFLSLNIYQSAYFGFNWDDVNPYQQRSAKLILGRPWLAARYLPHVFRWLGIAPALDPAVTLTSACLGYWPRQTAPPRFSHRGTRV